MKRYLDQLHKDIAYAIDNVQRPYVEKEGGYDLWEWKTRDEELRTAKKQSIEAWTGISRDALPPHELLSDEEVDKLYNALSRMLDVYNMSIVFFFIVPVRICYQVLRKYYDQELPMLQWNMDFFDVCPTKQTYEECLLGEGCHCRFMDEMRANQIVEELTPEEERARELDIEIRHIQRKYGDDWMKYYPYHLDPEYDDESGNPYDYGFGSFEDNDDDDDDDEWWRR